MNNFIDNDVFCNTDWIDLDNSNDEINVDIDDINDERRVFPFTNVVNIEATFVIIIDDDDNDDVVK